MAFQCVIVTPEQPVLDESVAQAIVPAHDGLIGILNGRAPLLVKLGLGPLRIDSANGQKKTYLIDGGVAQMKDNRLTILTNEATPTTQLSAETGRAEYAEASARKPTDEKTAEQRQRQLQHGRLVQQLASK
jgi:F-type H+-transporting ATPase subunit epsilon